MRVLVVEDNASLADAIQRGLDAEGFVVDVSADGIDGLWRAREFDYDAIVLDIMLPGLNGFEVCRSLRSEGVDTPILMLTAKDGDFDQVEGLELGADDYLTKPFSFPVFVARLRAQVRRGSGPRQPDVLEVDDLRLDTARHRCTRAGASIDLTPRERALLTTLMREPGQPFSRSELLDRVWGTDFDGDSNVVDVYVGYLRRKVDGDNDVKLIETVRGVGYQVAAP
ncbi:MAG: response regulator transcription factor [Actinomycetota bacterium]